MKYLKNSILSVLTMAVFVGCESDNSSNYDINQTNQNNYVQNGLYKNEPLFNAAWHFTKDSPALANSSYDPNSAINMVGAWEYGMGENVVIAIIDDGFQIEHEDFQGMNIVATYNSADNSSDVSNTNEGTIAERASHGTAVAGLIGAQINGVGTVGIAPKAKYILIKFGDTEESTLKALDYAAANGANIISNSWGTYDMSDAIQEKFAELKGLGITILFASGNDGINLDTNNITDESESEYVISIGSSNEFNDRSAYSNYGTSLDLLAPGGEYIGVVTVDEEGPYGYNDNSTYLLPANNNYTYFSGTSAACPIAAGIVALMIGSNPQIVPEQIKSILEGTATKIKSDSVSYDENGFNIRYGYGKIEPVSAITNSMGLPPGEFIKFQ